MAKYKKRSRVVMMWNKLMTSEILPVIWGTLILLTITASLTTLGILSVRWLLSVLGVIV